MFMTRSTAAPVLVDAGPVDVLLGLLPPAGVVVAPAPAPVCVAPGPERDCEPVGAETGVVLELNWEA